MAAPRRRNGITWVAAPQPTKGTARRPICTHCQSEWCHLCTGVGCFHACPDQRKHGVSARSGGAEHGAPGPGRQG